MLNYQMHNLPENCCQKLNRSDFKNEFKNTWWIWSASWIDIDNETKNEAKKCIQ